MLGLVRLAVSDRATGNAVIGATVTVYRTGTNVAPALFADPLGATVLASNVLTADPNGEVRFWVAGPVDLVISGTGVAQRTVRMDPVLRGAERRRRMGVVGGSVEWRPLGGWTITAAQVTRSGDTFTATLPTPHLMVTGMPVRASSRLRELRTDEVPCTVVSPTVISYPATYPASGNAIPGSTAVNIATPTRWSPESYLRKALMHVGLAGKWDVVGIAANPGDNWPEIIERQDEILALAAQCDVMIGCLGRDPGAALTEDGSGLLPLVRLVRQIRDLGCDFIEAEWKPVDTTLGAPVAADALKLLERARVVLWDESGAGDSLDVVDWIRSYGDPASTTGGALPGMHCERAHLNCDGAELAGEPFIAPLARRSPGPSRPLRSWIPDRWDQGGRCQPGANALAGLTSDGATVTVSETTPGIANTITVANGSSSDACFNVIANGTGTLSSRLGTHRGGAFRFQDLTLVNPVNGNLDVSLCWLGAAPLNLSNVVRPGDLYRVALHYALEQVSALSSFEVYVETGVGGSILGAGLWWGSTHTQAALATSVMNRAESGILELPRPVVIPPGFVFGVTDLRITCRLRFGAAAGTARLRVIDGAFRRIA